MYIPRVMEDVHKNNKKIRLYHRPDARHYIAKEGLNGDAAGIVSNPIFANPQRGKEAGTRLIVQIFLNRMDEQGMFKDIMGILNWNPMTAYGKYSSAVIDVCMDNTCQYKGSIHCSCLIRPYAIITWWKLINDQLVALLEPIRYGMSLDTLCSLMQAGMSGVAWDKFVGRKSKVHNTVQGKVLANIATMQRASLNDANPYGLSLGMFGYALETFEVDGEIFVGLAVGLREPERVLRKRVKKDKIEKIDKPLPPTTSPTTVLSPEELEEIIEDEEWAMNLHFESELNP